MSFRNKKPQGVSGCHPSLRMLNCQEKINKCDQKAAGVFSQGKKARNNSDFPQIEVSVIISTN